MVKNGSEEDMLIRLIETRVVFEFFSDKVFIGLTFRLIETRVVFELVE